METASVEFRGVERHKPPTLADDGGAIESINLRPTASGLELVHDKKLLFVADRLSDGSTINTVYRHRALPENCFVVMANQRKLIVYHEEYGKLVPTTDDNERLLYFAEYDEDILSLGELNNVLVVRLANRQDFYLWHENKYQLMPDIKMPQAMSLSQDFSSEAPPNAVERPFFQAILGFNTPNMNHGDTNEFPKKFFERRDSCLQFVQGLRAEEEANQRKLGKFVGHVLVRCAFKTAQGNYIQYGTVLHAEIGAWASTCRKSTFAKNSGDDKKLPYYKRIYEKILDDFTTARQLIYDSEDKGTDGYCPIPIACFRACVKNDSYDHTSINGKYNYQFSFSHNGIASNAGYSQLPVFVGAVPKHVWDKNVFRGCTNGNDERYGLRRDTGKSGWKEKAAAIGVYVPAIHYSYPIVRITVDNEFIEALKFYKETGIVTSLCVAMTAPAKHGNGHNLYKVRTITKDTGGGTTQEEDEDDSGILDSIETPGVNDYMYVYGYPRNPDADPEKLMNRNFYIVKDIELGELIDKVKDGIIEIPLQLRDIGAVEKTDSDGNVNVEVDSQIVANSLKEQVDPNYVSLNTIESAKMLPTDSFSTHTLLGGSFMEYNRRLHMFGVSVLMSDGYTPTSALEYDQDGFGENKIIKRGDAGFVDNLYMEAVVRLEKSTVVRRTPIESYLSGTNGGNIIMNDILTYPDYRCSKLRLVKKIGNNYHQIGNEFECKSSVLNNLAYAAHTFDSIDKLPDISFSSTHGLTIHTEYYLHKGNHSGYGDGKYTSMRYSLRNINGTPGNYSETNNNSNNQSIDNPFSYDASTALCAYKDDDILIYAPRVLDLSDINKTPIDYAGMDDSGSFEDTNRIQVSETDDVFSYPSKNSYRVGELDNRIIAAHSVYGQVTEQKFGMFPLYIFTANGIYTLEQGTGDILYQNVSKVNDDVLTDRNSLCNAGDMLAYIVADGLRLIQGKESQQVSDLANGMPFLQLHEAPFAESVSDIPNVPQGAGGIVSFTEDFTGFLSRVRLADEIQGGLLLWDGYNHEVVVLCKAQDGQNWTTWAYNVKSQQMYKRKDDLNLSVVFGTVTNGKSLAWGGTKKGELVTRANGFYLYDFSVSDQEKRADGSDDVQNFLYVSNPIKAGSPGYKHIEHSILRLFGQNLSMSVEYFGSLDGKKWFKMGGGKIESREEYSDMLMRRMPCSTRYTTVVIKGCGTKLQISRLDMELQQRYNTRLR